MTKYVTNGTLIKQNPPTLRRFILIAVHKAMAWVEAADGTMLSLPRSTLKDID